jgi:hypothetical protein
LSQIAVGFANGAVTLIRGDLLNDMGTKQRTVFESPEPITGVKFVEQSKPTTLYISTTGRILTLVTSGKGQGQSANVLETNGCNVGCMTIDHKTGQIVVARDNSLHYYTPHGRGPWFSVEGQKSMVKVFGDYVGIVTPAQDMSASFRRLGGSQAENLLNVTTFTILDIDLQFICQSQPFIAEVKSIFTEWGDLFVLTIDGKVQRRPLLVLSVADQR